MTQTSDLPGSTVPDATDIWQWLIDGENVEANVIDFPSETKAQVFEAAADLVARMNEHYTSAHRAYLTIIDLLNGTHGLEGWTRRDFARLCEGSRQRPFLFLFLDNATDKAIRLAWHAVKPRRSSVDSDAVHAAREPWPTFDDRPRCITHTQPEPCGVCRSYIAAGL